MDITYPGTSEASAMPLVDVTDDLTEPSSAPSAALAPRPAPATVHTHERDELTCVVAGQTRIAVGATTWVLGPTRALWIPAGTVHTVAPSPGSLTFPLFFPDNSVPWSLPRGIHVTDDLSRCIQVLLQPGLSSPEAITAAARRAVALLPSLSEDTLAVPLPRDPRALTVAQALLADPADGSSLEDWARVTYASSKTLQRLFLAETGMSFPRWRTQARLVAAVRLLREDVPVGVVAQRVGYATAGGFIQAFHKVTGCTPARYLPASEGTAGVSAA